MRKSLGSKRKELSEDHIAEITRLFGECKESSRHSPSAVASRPKADGTRSDACYNIQISRIFKNEEFRYHTITVERPERDTAGNIVLATKGKLKGKPQPDSNLRDTENVPLSEKVETYFKREVLAHAPDAWIDHEKTKVGYEIPFNRHFYVFKPPRELAEIDAELKGVIRYSNRLEVRNPGYSLKAEERLGQPGSETRNPKIAAVLHDVKFAETKGSGIRVMRELMTENSLSLPLLESDRANNSFMTMLLFHHFLSRTDIRGHCQQSIVRPINEVALKVNLLGTSQEFIMFQKFEFY